MKFKNHMAQLKITMSDERKSAILDRVAEMREFKMEMRDNTSDLTDEDKQELRAQFIEKAKNMQLAWISPHHQMNVGINADEIECREGHSLVMKKSNGVPMCLKADTALVMIERGIAVPAN
jgi:ABC-type Fe3+/spermidine/putrescine transport system ATPase subunit